MGNLIIKVWNGEAKYARLALYIPLIIISWLYRVGLSLRGLSYNTGLLKVEQAEIPVISVGNISLGGTGKTPVVEMLARLLKEKGFNPGIITRGYKRKKKGTFPVDVKHDSAESAGDEAFMLARRAQVPVIVGANRHQAIECGVRTFLIDMAILDDGFQVKNLDKDVDIVVINGSQASGKHDLFPLGPYREPFPRICEAQAILINKGDPGRETLSLLSGVPVFKISYVPAHLHNVKMNLIGHYSFLRGKRVAAFSGLGDNRSFFSLLRRVGAEVVHEIPFPDHHHYSARDIRKCTSLKNVEYIVTTEKDAVKLGGLEVPDNLYYLSIEVAVENEGQLMDLILGRIGRQAQRFMHGEFDDHGSGLSGSHYMQ